ncbi:MAG: PIG-L family deacetylase [Acidobacteriota bacterium]
MTTEADSIPYETVTLRGERLLVLAPHPDDEVIGCGGLLAAHLRDGRKVAVVIATDGGAAEAATGDVDAYRLTREQESLRGLAILGQPVDVRFLRFPDRSLASRTQQLGDALRQVLAELTPDLIAVPSPVEIHPDHLALSRAFCELVQKDGTLFAELATTRVLFYEVSQPIRPNTLLDISDVAEAKYEAVAAHATQLRVRDYVAFARGLNAYRAMTLPVGTRYAEAYWSMDLPLLRTTPFSEIQRSVSAAPIVTVTGESTPISVVVRTRNRPHLLKEALQSIRANSWPHEIIVVNDGGSHPEGIGEAKLIEHATARGRAEAGNAGAAAAVSPLLAFLDDDDLFYPEHLSTLSAASRSSPQHTAWYSDAVSAFLRIGASGTFEPESRQRLFGLDFDRDLLLLDNYIPLPALLFRADSFGETGGFDASFELFEDWDLLIRLSGRGTFVHLPVVTCEIRHFAGGDSITLAAPEGSDAFRAAKLKIWDKHRAEMNDEVFANAFERQKRRLSAMFSTLVEEKGQRHHSEVDLTRLLREKNELIGQLQKADGITREATLRIAALEPKLERALEEEAEARRASEVAAARGVEFQAAIEATQRSLLESQTTVGALYAEVHRLQGLLDTIYRSRTWKLHTIVEKVKGRG